MANEPKVTWKTTGRKLGQPDDPLPSIDVTEYLRSFSMEEGSEPYGIAIDAPLAVSMIKALWEKVSQEPLTNTLRQMLEGSYAITIDRNVLLKTISQPKCEGIRFYLCMKKGTTDEDVLSLVTVGVDETGKDLLYSYEENLPVSEIPTRSLVAEYGYPPGRLQQTGPATDPFVLFKFSQ